MENGYNINLSWKLKVTSAIIYTEYYIYTVNSTVFHKNWFCVNVFKTIVNFLN